MGIGGIWRKLAAFLGGGGGGAAAARPRKIDREYVSEFTVFMKQYLKEHPEVVADQARGRAIYWDKRVDFRALEKAAEDGVPAEPYAYYNLPAAPASPAAESGEEADGAPKEDTGNP